MLRAFLQISDTCSLVLAFALASLLGPYRVGTLSLEVFLSLRLKIVNFALFLGLLLVWWLIFRAVGAFDPSRQPLGRSGGLRVVVATALCTLVLGAASIPLNIEVVTPLSLVTFCVATSVLALGARGLLRSILYVVRSRPGDHIQNVLIVGRIPSSLRYASRVQEGPESGRQIVGFVDAIPPELNDPDPSLPEVVSDLKNLGDYLSDHVIDEVVVALPLATVTRGAPDFLGVLQEEGLTVRFLSSAVSPAGAMDAGSDVVITVHHGSLEGKHYILKRALDLSFSCLLLIALSPLLLVTSILVGATSRGPIFFTQERIGLNGRRFRVIKFRTMVTDAEERLEDVRHLNETRGPTFKSSVDPRTTQIGRVLRQTSIDELPQLINVLRGEMSLVGPRPLPLADIEGFGENRYQRRFSVRPGLTGLWQVSGRNSLPYERWMELDLMYVDNWSLRLDLEIMARTIPTILERKGAL
jgi:exopolysaccharide biosynthesis polyprenyl glycosylphosphotransferase